MNEMTEMNEMNAMNEMTEMNEMNEMNRSPPLLNKFSASTVPLSRGMPARTAMRHRTARLRNCENFRSSTKLLVAQVRDRSFPPAAHTVSYGTKYQRSLFEWVHACFWYCSKMLPPSAD